MRAKVLAVLAVLVGGTQLCAQTQDIQGQPLREPRQILKAAQVPMEEWRGKIVRVDLSSRPDTRALLEEIYSIGELEELALVAVRLTRDGWKLLPGFPAVKYLNLAFSDISDAALVELQSLPRLQSLNLSGTAVTDRGLVHLRGLKELRTVIVVKSRVTPAGAEALRRALPDVVVIGAR
jgi:hypothetical protein